MRADKAYVIAIIASYVAAGIALPWSPDDAHTLGPVALSHLAVMSFLLFGWCKAHARSRGVPPPYGAPFLMGAATLVGLPYYAIRAMGWSRGAWLCLKGIALLLGATLLSALGMLASNLARA
jgi:hypothetical protein